MMSVQYFFSKRSRVQRGCFVYSFKIRVQNKRGDENKNLWQEERRRCSPKRSKVALSKLCYVFKKKRTFGCKPNIFPYNIAAIFHKAQKRSSKHKTLIPGAPRLRFRP